MDRSEKSQNRRVCVAGIHAAVVCFILIPPFMAVRDAVTQEALSSPGNPAAVSCEDLGQWLCVSPFRTICY